MAHLSPVLKYRFSEQGSNNPLAFGKLYSYVAGTNTPKATYTDKDQIGANTNPIILDANGECDLWLGSGFYKFILKDKDDVDQWTVDKVSARGGEIDLTSQVTGVLPIANGGTNANSAATGFKNLSPITDRGDMIYGASGGTPARMAKGALGQKLYQGDNDPYWNFGLQTNQISNYSVTGGDETVSCNAASAGFTVTFPDPTTVANKIVTVVKTDSTANAITISGTGMTTNYMYGEGESKSFMAVGSAWIKISGFIGNPTSAGNLKIASSSTKTPTSSTYMAMTGNSFTLPIGVWEVQGTGVFANNGSGPGYTGVAVGIFRANGADTGTAPTALNGGNITVNSAYAGGITFQSSSTSGDNKYETTPIAIITVTASTTIYCVPYATATSTTNARVTSLFTAKRVG